MNTAEGVEEGRGPVGCRGCWEAGSLDVDVDNTASVAAGG